MPNFMLLGSIIKKKYPKVESINIESIKLNKIKDKFNGIQVTTFITGRLNHGIINLRTASSNQTRRPAFYKYTRLPVTRWVKLTLNLTKIWN